jgi:hypothetical protein
MAFALKVEAMDEAITRGEYNTYRAHRIQEHLLGS